MWQWLLTIGLVVLASAYSVWALMPPAWRARLRGQAISASRCEVCTKNHASSVISLWLMIAAFTGSGFAPPAWAEHSIVDDMGRTVILAAPARKIVSLAPGATELLFAAGAGDSIIATVQASDEPAAAKSIERIGDANALKYKRLQDLEPDVIVVWQDLANRLVVESLQKLQLPLYFVSIRNFEDIPTSIRRLGELAGTSRIADATAADLTRRINRLPKAPAKPRFDVFYMIWDSPLYTVGSRNLMSDAISRCGGRNIFDDIDFPAPIVEFEVIKERNPDVIIMAAPPITSRDWRERWQAFPDIKAVAANRLVSFTDTRLTRMGPTALDAVDELCKLMQALPD
jgi:iron complex transport system substrate-binding protein